MRECVFPSLWILEGEICDRGAAGRVGCAAWVGGGTCAVDVAWGGGWGDREGCGGGVGGSDGGVVGVRGGGINGWEGGDQGQVDDEDAEEVE